MAKSHQSSNREIRKPKSAKPKPVVQASPFVQPFGAANKKGAPAKKAR